MFERVRTSWDLANACRTPAGRQSLLIFPLLSSIAMFLIVASLRYRSTLW
jgi:hypothetical protein